MSSLYKSANRQSTAAQSAIAYSNEEKDAPLNEKMKYNDLEYKFPPLLSTVRKRTLIKSQFQRSTYNTTQRSAVCVLNNGAEYIYGPNCSLEFDFKNTGANPLAFATGSWVNIIRSVTLTSASGVEVERIDYVNLLERFRSSWTCDTDWYSTKGQLMGYTNTVASGATAHFSIPMWCLLGIYAYKSLLPSNMMAGARLEIQFENVATAFSSASAASYEIKNMNILQDSCLLDDNVAAELQKKAASTGLSIMFETYDHSSFSIDEDTKTGNFQASKAVSRATRAMVAYRLTDNVASQSADSFAPGETFDVSKWQFRLGSNYYPNQHVEVTADDADTKFTEFVKHANYSYDKVDNCYDNNRITHDLYSDANGYGILATTLERSPQMNDSGLPIASSRVLELRLTFGNGKNRTVDMWVQYTKAVRVFLDRVVVRQ